MRNIICNDIGLSKHFKGAESSFECDPLLKKYQDKDTVNPFDIVKDDDRHESNEIQDYENASKHKIHNYTINNKWEGVIEEISEDTVYARMYDFGSDTEDFIEFDIDDFNNQSIEEGDRFYFYVGYIENPSRSTVGLINVRKYYCQKPNNEQLDKILSKIHSLKQQLK